MILHVWKNALIHAEKCAAPTTTSGRCRRTSWREKQGTKRTRLERSFQGRECRQKKPDRIPEWQRDQFVSGSVSSVREAELSTKLSIVCCIKAWRTACRSSKEKETKKRGGSAQRSRWCFLFPCLVSACHRRKGTSPEGPASKKPKKAFALRHSTGDVQPVKGNFCFLDCQKVGSSD